RNVAEVRERAEQLAQRPELRLPDDAHTLAGNTDAYLAHAGHRRKGTLDQPAARRAAHAFEQHADLGLAAVAMVHVHALQLVAVPCGVVADRDGARRWRIAQAIV